MKGVKNTKEVIFQNILKTENGCWEWQLFKNPGGYGIVGFKGKTWIAHRLSYTLTKGSIPDKMLVCHTCDNRSCINPDHLFLGTQYDNMQDMVKKGRNNPSMQDKLGKDCPNSKAVFQYDLNMNFIKEWGGAAEIERELGFDNTCISAACNLKLKTSYGFIWRFKKDMI